MRHSERHEVNRLEMTETAEIIRFRFAELLAGVGARKIRDDHRRNRVEGVRRHLSGRAVVAGNDEAIVFAEERFDRRHDLVELFDHLALLFEVSVFAAAVGVLEVQEEEVVLIPILFKDFDFFLERGGLADELHADEGRESFVHRVDGDRGGVETVEFLIGRQNRLGREPAHSEAVRFRLSLEDLNRLVKEFFRDLRRLLGSGVFRGGIERRGAGALRVGVRNVAAESFASEDDDETVLFNRFDEDFDAGDRNRLQELNDFGAFFRRNTTGATVGNEAVLVDRAEIATNANVVRTDRERNARRFENAATNLEDERIVTEEPEVSGTAAGRNAGQDREGHAADALGGEFIEIRRVGGFEFGRSARLERESADTVGDDHDNFTAVGF